MADRLIDVTVRGAVRVILLDDAGTRNAFSPLLRDELWTELDAAAGDPSVRAIVLGGAGAGFCSGGNTKAMGTVTPAQKHASMKRTAQFALALGELPKPVVAAVHGYVVGAGLGLAFGCDLVVASEETRFVIGFTQLGLTPDMGVSYFLAQALGTRGAKQLLWEGRPFTAAWAQTKGLITDVVPPGDALTVAIVKAESLAAGPTRAFAAAKRIYSALDRAAFTVALDLEAEGSSALRESADHREGIAAWRERRAPGFHGN